MPQTVGAGRINAIRLLRHGDLAALVGTLSDDRPLGCAADLLAHDHVLAELVTAGTSVLPVRFGAVLEDEAAVVDELLAPHYRELSDGLDAVTGRVQYTVQARYEQDTVLREVVEEEPDVASLRGQPDGDSSTWARDMRLGELVVAALVRKREEDSGPLLSKLQRNAVDVRVHEPASADTVLDTAFLVERKQTAAFERAVENAGRRTAGRIRLRLLGPLPPYDFVPER